jgi:hypothetical protein
MGYTVWDAWWVELWGTFLFTLNVLSVTHCTVKTDGTVKALTVAIGLYVAINISIGISGGGINPGVGFNLQFWAMMMELDNEYYHKFEQFWIYLAAPLCGAILSGGLYFCIHNVFDKIKAKHSTTIKEHEMPGAHHISSHVDSHHDVHHSSSHNVHHSGSHNVHHSGGLHENIKVDVHM